MPWVPTEYDFDFDNIQLDIQPECDTTLTYYGRTNNSFLLRNSTGAETNDNDEFHPFSSPRRVEIVADRQQHDLNLIEKVRKNFLMPATIGHRPTLDDIDERRLAEEETVSMIRSAGSARSIDEGLSSARTIPTITNDRPHTKGKIPYLFEESYFQLRPRKSKSSSCENSLSTSSSANSSSSSSNSDSSTREDVDSNRKISEKAENDDGTVRKDAGKQSISSGLSIVFTTNNGSDTVNFNLLPERKTKKRLAINFTGNSVDVSNSSSSEFQRLRNNMKFYTPTEIYRKKRAEN